MTRGIVKLEVFSLTLCAALFWACSADDPAPDTGPAVEAGAPADVGLHTEAGVCVPSGQACGTITGSCVGDCMGSTCCSGLCAGGLCMDGNVAFGEICQFVCGGNPTGTWRFVGGCDPRRCELEGDAAAIFATDLTINADGSGVDSEIGFDRHCSGAIQFGAGGVIEGSWSSTDDTLGGFAFCARGDSLWVLYQQNPGLGAVTLEFARVP